MVRTLLSIKVFILSAFLLACGVPVSSDYSSLRGTAGGMRKGNHAGADFMGPYGDPIIASASGMINHRENSEAAGCGKGISIFHPTAKSGLYTVYCHMSKITVVPGEEVRRGDVIGYIGTSGNSANVPHVHFEVTTDGRSHGDGDLENTLDPKPFLVGCYDAEQTYPRDRLVLTNPVRCENK